MFSDQSTNKVKPCQNCCSFQRDDGKASEDECVKWMGL